MLHLTTSQGVGLLFMSIGVVLFVRDKRESGNRLSVGGFKASLSGPSLFVFGLGAILLTLPFAELHKERQEQQQYVQIQDNALDQESLNEMDVNAIDSVGNGPVFSENRTATTVETGEDQPTLDSPEPAKPEPLGSSGWTLSVLACSSRPSGDIADVISALTTALPDWNIDVNMQSDGQVGDGIIYNPDDGSDRAQEVLQKLKGTSLNMPAPSLSPSLKQSKKIILALTRLSC